MYGFVKGLGIMQNIELNFFDMQTNAMIRRANRKTRVFSSSSASSGEAQRKNEEKAANVKNDESNIKNETAAEETKNENKSETVNEKKETPKAEAPKKESKKQAEQKKKAEAEAPVEPAGAEKVEKKESKKETPKASVEAEKNVNGNAEAAMDGRPVNPYVEFKEQQAGFTPDFSSFIVNDGTPNIHNVGDIMGNVKNVYNNTPNQQPQYTPQQQQAFYQPHIQPQQAPPMQRFVVYQPPVQQQPMNQQPIGGFQVPQQFVQQQPQQQAAVTPNIPVMNPQDIVRPANAKEQQEVVVTPNINVDDGTNKSNDPASKEVDVTLNIETDPSLNKKVKYPGPIQEVTNPSAEELAFSNKFDNSEMIQKYPILQQIQDVASKNKVHVKFTVSATPGIIHVDSYDQNRRLDLRSFILDTGVIIDNRIKVYPFNKEMLGDNLNFERSIAFCATKRDKNNEGKKKGFNQVFNEGLFDIIFKGGIGTLSGDQGMFSPELMNANLYVDMITMLKFVRNKQQREAVRKSIISTASAGVFEYFRQQTGDHEIRFNVIGVDDKNTVTLQNGAAINYGRDAYSTIPITIEILADGTVNTLAPGAVTAS